MERIKLKEKIKEKGYRLDFIARKLEISTYGLSLKLSGKSDFKWGEILELCKILKLSEKEKKEIFLIKKVNLIHLSRKEKNEFRNF